MRFCRKWDIYITITDTNASYINLSMAILEKVTFKDTILKNSYFQETKIKI